MGYTLKSKPLDAHALTVQMRRRLSIIVGDTAHEIAETAKRLVPVDTGNLRESIQSMQGASDPLTATVEVGADYAAYVEEGTSRMAAQPYLEPAVAMNEGEFFRAIEQALEAVER